MKTDIKPGDLVMVVRPTLCCGNASSIGTVGIAEGMATFYFSQCFYCQRISTVEASEVRIGDFSYDNVRLKKLDPPALADNTETQRELEEV